MTDQRKPSKEYRARIFVKLTEDVLPQPALSSAELLAHLTETLNIGDPDSPIVSITVDDPRTTKRRY
jgi:hypothetical protein